MKNEFYQVFPFGKFKDQDIYEIDTKYLVHALENYTLPKDLVFAIKRVIAHKLDIPSYVRNGYTNESCLIVHVNFGKNESGISADVIGNNQDEIQLACEYYQLENGFEWYQIEG